ncbi:hypothetical protein RIF29_35762 [Crotalaria pallida]|uniref:Uncharacterized protein n=1 Tax=Crotalaria pallida TaxID=3830 RepID=A0AAN9EAM6_CROPI
MEQLLCQPLWSSDSSENPCRYESSSSRSAASSRSPFGIAGLVDMEEPACRAHGGGSITHPKSILLYSQFQPVISTTFSPCGGERLRFNGWWRLLKGWGWSLKESEKL